MKTVKQSISNASFIGSILKLLFKKIWILHTLKSIILLSVVLLCILIRLIVLSGDKVKFQYKSESAPDKLMKFRIRVPGIYSEINNPSTQKIDLFRFRNVEFKQHKNSTQNDISN